MTDVTKIEAFVDTSLNLSITEVEIEVFNSGAVELNFVYPLKGDPGDLEVDSALDTSNQTFDGMTTNLTAAEILTFGDLCYIDSTGKVSRASATSVSTARASVLATKEFIENEEGPFLLIGFIRNDAWDWTPGAELYLSLNPGAVVEIPPTGTNNAVQVIGLALDADRVFFNPSNNIMVHA